MTLAPLEGKCVQSVRRMRKFRKVGPYMIGLFCFILIALVVSLCSAVVEAACFAYAHQRSFWPSLLPSAWLLSVEDADYVSVLLFLRCCLVATRLLTLVGALLAATLVWSTAQYDELVSRLYLRLRELGEFAPEADRHRPRRRFKSKG